MKLKTVLAAIAATSVVSVPTVVVLASGAHSSGPTLVRTVRESTRPFHDVDNATGYVSLGACVNSPEEGAMGVHYANVALIEDGQLDAATPELLVYEQRHGRLHLVGVEYLVLASQWNDPSTGHAPGAPVLQGQLFNYVGAPNRYGLEPFYELHVWAWRDNPKGTFADFNPRVSCDEYAGEGMSGMDHG